MTETLSIYFLKALRVLYHLRPSSIITPGKRQSHGTDLYKKVYLIDKTNFSIAKTLIIECKNNIINKICILAIKKIFLVIGKTILYKKKLVFGISTFSL